MLGAGRIVHHTQPVLQRAVRAHARQRPSHVPELLPTGGRAVHLVARLLRDGLPQRRVHRRPLVHQGGPGLRDGLRMLQRPVRGGGGRSERPVRGQSHGALLAYRRGVRRVLRKLRRRRALRLRPGELPAERRAVRARRRLLRGEMPRRELPGRDHLRRDVLERRRELLAERRLLQHELRRQSARVRSLHRELRAHGGRVRRRSGVLYGGVPRGALRQQLRAAVVSRGARGDHRPVTPVKMNKVSVEGA